MSPQNPDTHTLSYCTTRMGVFKKLRVVLEYDDLSNVTKSETIGWNNMFYIPWDNGNSARKVIEEFGGVYRNTVLAIAKEAGDEWHTGNTYTVFNLEEWLKSDSFEDLLAANRGGFLKNEYGGTVLYQRDKVAKRKQLEAQIQEFKRSDKAKG